MINKSLTLKDIRILLISGTRIHIVPEKGKRKDGEGSTCALKIKQKIKLEWLAELHKAV